MAFKRRYKTNKKHIYEKNIKHKKFELTNHLQAFYFLGICANSEFLFLVSCTKSCNNRNENEKFYDYIQFYDHKI